MPESKMRMFQYNKNIKYYWGIVLVLAGVVVLVLVWILGNERTPTMWPHFERYLYINNKKIKIAVADTPAKRQRGFMFVKKVPENSGILFIFEKESKEHCFWMKNTRVKLSIAFINKEKEIIEIKDMTPLDLNLVCPKEKILYALEVEQGYFEKNNIKEKDKIRIE
ncbi:MAG: DUF192 domain-containing protein [Planctomycetota bacterium]